MPYQLGLYLRISIAHFKWRHIVWNLRFLTELHRQVCLHIDFHWISLGSVRLFSLLSTRQLLKVTTILNYRLSRQALRRVTWLIFTLLSILCLWGLHRILMSLLTTNRQPQDRTADFAHIFCVENLVLSEYEGIVCVCARAIPLHNCR